MALQKQLVSVIILEFKHKVMSQKNQKDIAKLQLALENQLKEQEKVGANDLRQKREVQEKLVQSLRRSIRQQEDLEQNRRRAYLQQEK